MSSIPYEKWDATGNDFVVVDLQHSPLTVDQFPAPLVVAMCDRQHGVGADGVVLLEHGREGAPAHVMICNSDGSPSAMCGNALRCVALLLARQRGAGVHRVLLGERLLATRADGPDRSRVTMGRVAPVGDRAPLSSLPELDELLGGRGYLLSFGNPHYVVVYDEIPADWVQRGEAAQSVAHRLLGTGGINCGFLQRPTGRAETTPLRVFERGAGVTQSCGSGACAASAVVEQALAVAPPHCLRLLGGVLEVGRSDGEFELAGPARQEFVGRWSLS